MVKQLSTMLSGIIMLCEIKKLSVDSVAIILTDSLFCQWINSLLKNTVKINSFWSIHLKSAVKVTLHTLLLFDFFVVYIYILTHYAVCTVYILSCILRRV